MSEDTTVPALEILVAFAETAGPLVRRRSMFGHPALVANGKMFACEYGGRIGCKVPEPRVRELLACGEGSSFRPYGKSPMREWVEVTPDRAQRSGLLDEALAFVLGGE